MQRGLYVDLALWGGRAVVEAVDMPFCAGNRCQQGMGLMSLHVKILVSRPKEGQPAAFRQAKQTDQQKGNAQVNDGCDAE